MTDHPANDEIEISLFGPGYGEAILVHYGNGLWLAIDSCIDPVSSANVPLTYLMGLGVDPATQLKMVLATHWHDDHVRGISKLLSRAEGADFYCSQALTNRDFVRFAVAHNMNDPSPLSRATKEIVTIFRLLKSKGRTARWVGPDRLLLNQQTSSGVITLHSLSPTDENINRFIERIVANSPLAGTQRIRVPELRPNDISVGLLLSTPTGSAIFGADIEEALLKNWTQIVLTSQVLKNSQSEIFKVSHHGSETGHHDPLWEEHLQASPIAVLTPWKLGQRSIPEVTDIDRILTYTTDAYSTANPISTSPNRRTNTVDRQLRSLKAKISMAFPRAGQLRLRRKISDSKWNIQMFGTAIHLKSLRSLIINAP